MTAYLHNIYLIAVLAPLLGSIVAGFFGQVIGRTASHRITITGIAIAFIMSLLAAKALFIDGANTQNILLYHWANADLFHYSFSLGFLIDRLSSLMMIVVTFVSLLVHIYSIGYMAEDSGYQRFFSYMSLFTFAMLMLISANNFLQLFFGWEGVGLVSYLLIGFWFKRESAIQGNLKAFIVNRVGDFGFLLGIAMIFAFAGSLDYQEVFAQASTLSGQHVTLIGHTPWSVISVICILLFVGAMGKSAQMPLHIWLPESMEGPTPISALIHAATMVTAGVFMVARMSPLFEHSEAALSFVLVIGATGALFTGLLAIVMTDIKRVVAYSTLSQLGYMMVAMGASAYQVGMFHLATHACFKALMFLAAGSVIIIMHHEHDMRKMGGLRKYMPITYVTALIGSLALAAIPPFAGYFSKDLIIEAAKEATVPGAQYAYYCVLIGAFVTALYTFRAFFMTYHTEEKMSEKLRAELREPPWVVWLPLVILAVPSVFLGAALVDKLVFAKPALLDQSLFILDKHNVMAEIGKHFHGAWPMLLEAATSPTFWLSVAGVVSAWLGYIVFPSLPAIIAKRFAWFYQIFVHKYGFDDFNDLVIVRGARQLGEFFFGVGEIVIIDGIGANGSGRSVRWLSRRARVMQSGYLYHYAFVMVLGLLGFLMWLMLG